MKKLPLLALVIITASGLAQETEAPPPPETHRDLELTVNPFTSKLLKTEEYKINTELEKARQEAYGVQREANVPAIGQSVGIGQEEISSLKIRVEFLEQELQAVRDNPPVPVNYNESAAAPPPPPPPPAAGNLHDLRQSYGDERAPYSGISQNKEGEFKEVHNPNVVYRGIVSLGTEKKLSYYDKTKNRSGLAIVGDVVPKPFITNDAAEDKTAKVNEIADSYVIIGFKKIVFNDSIYTNHHRNN